MEVKFFRTLCSIKRFYALQNAGVILPISGTLVTDGIPGLFLVAFSRDDADLLHLSSGIAGRDLL